MSPNDARNQIVAEGLDAFSDVGDLDRRLLHLGLSEERAHVHYRRLVAANKVRDLMELAGCSEAVVGLPTSNCVLLLDNGRVVTRPYVLPMQVISRSMPPAKLEPEPAVIEPRPIVAEAVAE